MLGRDGIELTGFGKAHDPTGSHDHHYSLWIAHHDVEGHDFWSENGGVIQHVRFDSLEDGPVFCRMVQQTAWLAPKEKAAPANESPFSEWLLKGRRTWTVYRAAEDWRLIDLTLELQPAGDKPVTLGKNPFGLFSVRTAESMTVFDGGGEIINSRSEVNEHNAFRKPADWIDLSGPIAEDRWGGVTLMSHPKNPRHPPAWHCRNDGWAGASFTLDEPYTIAPGEPLVLRYRVVLHRHNAERAGIATRYREYAAEANVTLGSLRVPSPPITRSP